MQIDLMRDEIIGLGDINKPTLPDDRGGQIFGQDWKELTNWFPDRKRQLTVEGPTSFIKARIKIVLV